MIKLEKLGIGYPKYIKPEELTCKVAFGSITSAGILKITALHVSSLRLHPVFMTLVLGVFGLIPHAMGLGEGTDSLQIMAVSATGGLLFHSLLFFDGDAHSFRKGRDMPKTASVKKSIMDKK